MAKGKGAHWQPPGELNSAPPTMSAPHMGDTHRSDVYGNPGTNTNLKGIVGRAGGTGKAEVRGDGNSNRVGNLPETS